MLCKPLWFFDLSKVTYARMIRKWKGRMGTYTLLCLYTSQYVRFRFRALLICTRLATRTPLLHTVTTIIWLCDLASETPLFCIENEWVYHGNNIVPTRFGETIYRRQYTVNTLLILYNNNIVKCYNILLLFL